MGKNYKPISVTVKETIDLVFELTSSNPGGYEMKANDLGRTGKLVARILVQRGILERTRAKGKKHSFLYKWVAGSAPTKVLYGSVTQELGDNLRKMNKRYNAKKAVKKDPVVETVQSVADEAGSEFPLVSAECDCIPLDKYSVLALWEELKRRGCFIKDGRLACVTYID